MITLLLISILLVTLIGAGVFAITKYLFTDRLTLTKNQFLVGLLVSALLLAPIITVVGWEIGKASKLQFNEYWNGYELSAPMYVIGCTRDGPCVHEYSCDPYQVWVPPTYDDKGHQTGGGYFETHYHSCPYTTQEWSFIVSTTLGDYTIADHWLPTSPDSVRWRSEIAVPNNLPSGIPTFWQQAKDRIDAGKPGPVTKRMQYDNYILASDSSILKTYGDKIAYFSEAKLLPSISSVVHDFYYADKVYFVGLEVLNKTPWLQSMQYLNAALGTELQGDIHLVVTKDPLIDAEKDAYLTSLKAYWSNPENFGKEVLSKNTILVVVGTDGNIVTWARAITGMPLGNEYMLTQLQNRLQGVSLTPEAVIGSVQGEFYMKGDKLKVKPLHDNPGILSTVLWGLDDPASKFQRISMTNNSEDDVGGGFMYLSDEVQPTEIHQWIIMVTIILLTLVMWGIMVYINTDRKEYNGYSYR